VLSDHIMSGHKRIPYVQAQYASLDSEVTGQRSWYVQAGKQSGWQSVCVAACAGDEPGMRQATRPPSTSAPAATPGTGAPSRPARSAAKLGACGVASRDLSLVLHCTFATPNTPNRLNNSGNTL